MLASPRKDTQFDLIQYYIYLDPQNIVNDCLFLEVKE